MKNMQFSCVIQPTSSRKSRLLLFTCVPAHLSLLTCTTCQLYGVSCVYLNGNLILRSRHKELWLIHVFVPLHDLQPCVESTAGNVIKFMWSSYGKFFVNWMIEAGFSMCSLNAPLFGRSEPQVNRLVRKKMWTDIILNFISFILESPFFVI